jgi:hypothetical protein
MPNESPMPILLKSIGIDKHSFERFVSWALSEHLVGSLSSLPQIKDSDLFNQLDALKQFRNILKRHTTRDWSAHDVNALFERVKEQLKVHYRKPIEYGEYLKLLWQVPLECATCKKTPPDVLLHVDHIVPASKGGSSQRGNLQFLCATHNLKKSNNREVSDIWLDFQ